MEHIDRQTYDPHEPLVIAHGDLLAARNAVTQLVMILRSLGPAEHLPAGERQDRRAVRRRGRRPGRVRDVRRGRGVAGQPQGPAEGISTAPAPN